MLETIVLIGVIGALAFSAVSIYMSITSNKKIDKIDEIIGSAEDIFENPIGTVTAVPELENYYLGSILINNAENQIIIYSDDKLERGDKFVITGYSNTKIFAKKLGSDQK